MPIFIELGTKFFCQSTYEPYGVFLLMLTLIGLTFKLVVAFREHGI